MKEWQNRQELGWCLETELEIRATSRRKWWPMARSANDTQLLWAPERYGQLYGHQPRWTQMRSGKRMQRGALNNQYSPITNIHQY